MQGSRYELHAHQSLGCRSLALSMFYGPYISDLQKIGRDEIMAGIQFTEISFVAPFELIPLKCYVLIFSHRKISIIKKINSHIGKIYRYPDNFRSQILQNYLN